MRFFGVRKSHKGRGKNKMKKKFFYQILFYSTVCLIVTHNLKKRLLCLNDPLVLPLPIRLPSSNNESQKWPAKLIVQELFDAGVHDIDFDQ